MEIYLAHPQGFCAGVSRAIEILNQALAKYVRPLYAYHEIVHNTAVVNDFKTRGVIFVDSLGDIPQGSRIVFSAHGVSPAIIEQAKKKNLNVIDATCPLVAKIHKKAIKFSEQNIDTVLIGHRMHQEMIGTAGYVKPDLLHYVETEDAVERLDIDPQKKVGYLTQTTLSVAEVARIVHRLKQKYPNIIEPPTEDVCFATERRQNAIRELAKMCEMIVVCGSPNSSNSNRLRETGQKANVLSVIVDSAEEFDVGLLKGKNRVCVSSGASVPYAIVEELLNKIKTHYPQAVIHTSPCVEKDIVFSVPSI